MRVTVISIVVDVFGTVAKGLEKYWRDWKSEEKSRWYRLQPLDRLEYWEESWRLEETCHHSNSSVKISQGMISHIKTERKKI